VKIAGWEVPRGLVDAAERRMRERSFNVVDIRAVAADSRLLPGLDNINMRYIRDEIGTRLIAHFKHAGKIRSIDGSRCWEWVGGAR